MGFEVDPAFRNTGRKAKSRRRRRQGLRIAVAAGVFLCVIGFGWGIFAIASSMLSGDPVDVAELDDPTAGEGDDDLQLVQSEDTAESAIDIDRQNSFVDLRRDPMILRFAATEEQSAKELPAPPGVPRDRLTTTGASAIVALKDTLFVTEKSLVTTLPSSRNDFALFKAQRSQGLRAQEAPVPQAQVVEAAAGELVQVSEESSWGSFITDDGTEGEAENENAVYVETKVENTTSVAVTLRDSQRKPLYEDKILVLNTERSIPEILQSNGFPEAEAVAVGKAVKDKLGLKDTLGADSIVALRYRPEGIGARLMLMSLYSAEGYLASLAQVGAGRFESAADPWISENLMRRSSQMRQESQRPGDIRLLDAFYSAAIRNGMPTKQVGELIVVMSQRFDLDRFVVKGDEVVILRANGEAQDRLGQVLYVGLHSPTAKMRCFLLPNEDEDGFTCYDFDAPPASAGGGAGGMGGGLVIPVNGVKTSGFGPRHHPILKQVRNHNGVDWAAPTGTPIQAAAAGTVHVAGNGGGYGNVVYIDHGQGIETRYAHLNAFAKGLRKGTRVAAGQIIGYVGTTGRSTGPHLHFELRVRGNPVDPLTYAGSTGSGPVSTGGTAGTKAVEELVNQIIRVESAGNANAKNPLSTATGLGQFIQSTWLRMMRDYRPDLVKKMNKAQLLALRTDPALSREMVRNLARENEAFLRARGHQITAGRLYLAHFLGPAGANTALKANPSATVLSVMGSAVVNANPFLRGKSIADLRNWADRKMRGRKGRASAPVVAAAPVVRTVPPEALAYRKAIEELLTKI